MIKYKITLEDYLNAQKIHTGYNIYLIYLLIGFLYILIQVLLNLVKADSVYLSGNMFLHFFVIMVMVLSFHFIRKFRLKQIYMSQKTWQTEIEFSFDDKGFQFFHKSGTFKSKWEDVCEYKIGKELILLYEGKNLMRMVSVYRLQETRLYERVVSILKEKCR